VGLSIRGTQLDLAPDERRPHQHQHPDPPHPGLRRRPYGDGSARASLPPARSYARRVQSRWGIPRDGGTVDVLDLLRDLVAADRRAAVWCAAQCARTALHLIPAGEDRPRVGAGPRHQGGLPEGRTRGRSRPGRALHRRSRQGRRGGCQRRRRAVRPVRAQVQPACVRANDLCAGG
jgi:hypothetical protein